jgi:hypothetical protein
MWACHSAAAAAAAAATATGDRSLYTVQWLCCLQRPRALPLDYSRSAPPANRHTPGIILIRIRESCMMELRETKFE